MKNEGIGPWVHRKRERSKGKVAISYRDERTTYEVLAERIARLANALADRGIHKGDRVAYLGNNHPSFLETLFAATSIGAVFVPLNTRLAAPEIELALKDSGSSALIFNDELRELALAATAKTQIATRMLVGGEQAGTGAAALEVYENVVASGAPNQPDVEVALDDAAIILYTSGTTGRPKGAVLSHGNLHWNSFNVMVDFGVSPGEQVLLISPMFHVASLTNGALTALLQGGTVVLHEKFDAGQVLAAIESERITMLSGVPTTFQLMQEHPNWASADISSLRRLTCGGSAVPERTIEAYEARGLGFSAGYGMTETSPGASALPADKAKEKVGSSGLAHFFTEVKIVDEHGDEVPAGVDGEIWVRGPNVIREYWQQPEATEAAFVDDWFRSGDLGHFDDEGYLYITDRLKDMIISGGENIYSAQVEAVMMELTAIESVALIGVPDEKWGEVPHAYVELQPGASLSASVIIAHMTGRLAKYKIPKKIIFVEEFPRTASGKIQKAELRKRATT